MADNVPPIEYPDPVDVVALARSYESDGERGPLSISSCPKHVTWAVESLSDRAGVSLARTYACLLERGMWEIWRFPGARELQRAREAIVARGDRDEMRWIDAWDFDVPTADTGQTIQKVRLSVEGILTPLGKLRKVLAFTKSKTAVLALTATLLDDTEVPIRYHEAQYTLMRDLARARAERATKYAGQRVDPGGTPPPRRYSLRDVVGVRV